MRSLPVLLIALALLPLSTSLECYTKITVSGFPAEKMKEFDAATAKIPAKAPCDPATYSSEYCSWMVLSGAGFRMEGKGCTLKGVADKCKDKCIEHSDTKEIGGQKLTGSGQLCCCKGDLCSPVKPSGAQLSESNGAAPSHPTSGLLLSLAAVAAAVLLLGTRD